MGYLGNNLQAAYSNYQLIDSLTASFNGTTTSFPLRVNSVIPVPFPLNEQNVLISVGGVPQKPDPTGAEGFKFLGTNIVFSSAPKTGEAFWGVILAGADYVNAGAIYPDGSAAVPSITFGNEKSTGFCRLGSGVLGVSLTGVLEASFSGAGLNLYGSTSGTTTLAAPDVAGNNVLTLPTGSGSALQVLRNSATPGLLEFATLSSVITPSFQIFVSSSTWTCPTNVTSAIVGVVGGGGGGVTGIPGSGGYGGLGVGLVSVTPGTVYTVTVGAGGAGGNASAASGGTSSFGPQGQTVLISASGGGAGFFNGSEYVTGANGSCSSAAANLRRIVAAYPLPYTDGAATKGGFSQAAVAWSITSGLIPGAYGAAGNDVSNGSSGGGGGGVVTIQYWG